MKLKLKMVLLGLSTGMVALQLANCTRFWGDMLGDIWVLGAVD